MDPRTRFIKCIYCLVRQVPVTDVSVGEANAGFYCPGCVGDIVVLFVAFLNVIEDFYCLFDCCGVNEHLLETAFQCAILLDMLAVLVKGCSANALNLTSCQCRLEHVCGIKRAAGSTCTHNGMYLVNKENDIFIFCQLIENSLHSLFKLSAVFRAGNNRCQVQCHNSFVEEYPRDISLGDPQRQSFCNC